ncbi:hypothetical protein [Paraflavitalea speifideaquila]|uniref:hypothetical protein n=1 Tax=Paraflavitalea speifideaquila TaxID=3076558 RepID=UPI0028EF934F|nr:hypothetical protein [Paraflavitalea speifideiaquila]
MAENAVYNNDATAISVLTAMYSDMNTTPFQGSLTFGSVALFAGLAADEYTLAAGITQPTYLAFYQNALLQTDLFSNRSRALALVVQFCF